MTKQQQKKPCGGDGPVAVVEGYTMTTTSIGAGQNITSISSTTANSSISRSISSTVPVIRLPRGEASTIVKKRSSKNGLSTTSTIDTIIIPSYPANNYVQRRNFISLFCIILLTTIFSYGGFNAMIRFTNTKSNSSSTTTTTARSLFLGSNSMLGSSSSSSISGSIGGGIFSSSRKSVDVDTRHQDTPSTSSSFATTVNAKNTDQHNKSPEDYFVQVRSFLNANEPRMALQVLLEADLMYPNHVELKLYLGSTYTLLMEYEKAIGAYQQSLNLIERQQEQDKKSNSTSVADNKLYKMRALTMMGVLYRGRGKIDEAIYWLENSVAYNDADRENRNYLAQCYFLKGNVLDASEHLIQLVQRELAEDDDYRLLSYALSAMEEWQLLGGFLQQCLYYGYCTLSYDSVYTPDQIMIEYAVALDKVGQSEMALTQLQEAVRIASSSSAKKLSSSSSQQPPTQTLQDARQRAQTYISEAEEGTRKALAWNDQQEDPAVYTDEASRRWEEMAKVLQTCMRIGLPAWSIMFERHYNNFLWPIQSFLADLINKEIKDDKAAVDAAVMANNSNDNNSSNVSSPFLLPNRIPEIISRSACHSIPIYTFSDCIFYAKVSGAKRQHALQLENKVTMQSYNDFQQATYRPLLRDTDVLHLGIFSDLKYPMLNLIWSLIRNTHRKNNVNTNIRVTLYHPPGVTASVMDFVEPMVSITVECTQAAWFDCVEHARRNKVQVWLEASGDAVEGIPNIMASGPAPVGISWGGTLPGSLGLPSTVQYMITDRYSVPPESAVSAEYPEKMIYIPGSWLNVEPEAVRVGNLTIGTVRKEYNIPANAVIYCYFGRLNKITDDTLRLWAEIVIKVPGSVLVLCNWHPSTDPIPRMRKLWSAKGLASDRLIFFPFFSFGGHLSILSALSEGTTIALDALEYSGAMTAYNAIQAGIPVIHCSTSWKITQRMAGSVLTAGGLAKDLIVSNVVQYEELAVLMGTNATAYQEIKNKTVNARPRSPLFQNRYGLSGMLAGLRMAYQLWYAGRPPQTMYADTPQEFPTDEQRKSSNSSNKTSTEK